MLCICVLIYFLAAATRGHFALVIIIHTRWYALLFYSCSFSHTDLYSVGLFFRFSNFPWIRKTSSSISRYLKRRTRGGSGRDGLGGGHGIQRWGCRSSLLKISRSVCSPRSVAVPCSTIKLSSVEANRVSSLLSSFKDGPLSTRNLEHCSWPVGLITDFFTGMHEGLAKGIFTHVVCRLWSSQLFHRVPEVSYPISFYAFTRTSK
jgi:hypothetical protein